MFTTCKMVKLELVFVLFLSYTSVLTRCQAFYWRYRPEVTMEVGTLTKTSVGSYAEYGNYKAEVSSSKLILLPENDFGCNSRLSPNTTEVLSSTVGLFVLMIPLDYSRCSDYQKAIAGKLVGAAGVLFYYTSSNNRQLSSGSGLDKLPIPVAAIELSETTFNAIQEQLDDPDNRSLVSIVGKYYQNIQTSQTFYFVVFSFCILTLLSCLWFMLSYIRKCRTKAQRRQRRAQAEREARQLVDSLPTKTHKSLLGVEEPTCAICLEMFHNKETIRVLPCHHEFHKKCIDPWLKLKRTCPMCKEDIAPKKVAGKAHNQRRPARNESVSSDEASSARLLSHDMSNLSLDSSSSEQTDNVVLSHLVVEDLEDQNRQHSVVMFEGELADRETTSPPVQQANSEEAVAIQLDGMVVQPTE